jgi:hypothetical protein
MPTTSAITMFGIGQSGPRVGARDIADGGDNRRQRDAGASAAAIATEGREAACYLLSRGIPCGDLAAARLA